MLTVDEASSLFGLSVAGVVAAVYFAGSVASRRRSFHDAASAGNVFAYSFAYGFAGIVLSAPVLHIWVVGDRYRHLALFVWGAAILALLVLSALLAGCFKLVQGLR